MTAADTRAGYVAGLRALADLLEANEELALPYEGRLSPITFHFLSAEDPRAALATFVRIMPGSFDKTMFGVNDEYFELRGSVLGLTVAATAYRQKVCTRVVTGTREVTEEVPDPDALAAVPRATVTRTEDVVEWVCEPLLADRERVTA